MSDALMWVAAGVLSTLTFAFLYTLLLLPVGLVTLPALGLPGLEASQVFPLAFLWAAIRTERGFVALASKGVA